jgi:hypothetical protein
MPEKPQGAEGNEQVEVRFSSFILMLGTTALQHMGEIPNPTSNKKEVNEELARLTIDTITMLKEKTTGNLSKEEESLVLEMENNLQNKYVQTFKSK